MINFYMDENLPPSLGRALNELEKARDEAKVVLTRDEFGLGAQDEDWVPKLSGSKACILTQDKKMKRIRQVSDAYRKNKLGLIFLQQTGNLIGYWEQVRVIIKTWQEIKEIISRQNGYFCIMIKMTGSIEVLESSEGKVKQKYLKKPQQKDIFTVEEAY